MSAMALDVAFIGPQVKFATFLRTIRLRHDRTKQEVFMGRGILLWLIGIPIPIIILLALVWR